MDIVATGGAYRDPHFKSTEIFSLETMYWRSGPDLPKKLYSMAPVQLGGTFAITGGIDENFGRHSVGDIYQFNKMNYTWTKIPEVLKIPRQIITECCRTL